MSIKLVIATVCALGVLGGWSNGVRAESQNDRDACIGDVHAHCGEYIPDRDAIIQCLKQKVKQLSPACRTVMTRPYRKDAARN
jgi:hypothetical protein